MIRARRATLQRRGIDALVAKANAAFFKRRTAILQVHEDEAGACADELVAGELVRVQVDAALGTLRMVRLLRDEHVA